MIFGTVILKASLERVSEMARFFGPRLDNVESPPCKRPLVRPAMANHSKQRLFIDPSN
jgi:hypothetical protein